MDHESSTNTDAEGGTTTPLSFDTRNGNLITVHPSLVSVFSNNQNNSLRRHASDDDFQSAKTREADMPITPMTSRPHCLAAQQNTGMGTGSTGTNQDYTMRRIRSRSLGAAQEAAQALQKQHGYVSPLAALSNGIATQRVVPDSIPEASRLPKQRTSSPSNAPAAATTNSIGICVLYGLINATIVLPVLMSFGSIIYRDAAFGPYMPVLVKLTVVSGIVHQVVFSTFSALPFAVGQVQDAGLIFLSGMSSYMVQYCREYSIHNNHNTDIDDATMLATVTVGLGLCTALLGCGLVLIGKLQLAQYVQMLPTR
jgi:hypothetical protein